MFIFIIIHIVIFHKYINGMKKGNIIILASYVCVIIVTIIYSWMQELYILYKPNTDSVAMTCMA